MSFLVHTALCGVSGVVFACILLSSYAAFKEGEIALRFMLVALLFVGAEIYTGLTVQDNVLNLTHVLGGTYVINPKQAETV